jgi:hypothetical protein
LATVRISPLGHNSLKNLSKKFNKSIPQIIDMLLEKYESEIFFSELNESILRAKENKKLWNEIKNEKKVLDGTLKDDLDDDTYYTEDEIKEILK